MKKVLAILLVTAMLFAGCLTVSAARVGTVIGKALHTDIVAYINNYAIPSYAVNGQSAIVAEDLRNFCFNVVWDGNARTLTISKNPYASDPVGMSFKKNQSTGTKFADILATDIKVYANGKNVTSYAINGYTMIPVEELTMLGTVTWKASDRALYMSVNGMKARSSPQKVDKTITKSRLSKMQAQATLKNWLGGNLGTWVDGKENVLSCNDDTYWCNGKEYYQFRLGGWVDNHTTTLTWFIVSVDGTEIYEGWILNGEIDIWSKTPPKAING